MGDAVSRYVALLRGINLGSRTIKMDALRQVCEAQGLDHVRTVLASGNVVFDSKTGSPAAVRAKLEAALKAAFGFEVHVIVRRAGEIQALVEGDPFKGVKMTPKTRLYVTFLSEPARPKLKIPKKTVLEDFEIIRVSQGQVCTVLGPKAASTDALDFLEKIFGKNITTRNWNTIQKIHALMQSL